MPILSPTAITKIPRPWGHELVWASTDVYVGRLLHLRKGESISRQYHTERQETLYLLSGTVLLTLSSRDEMHTRTMVPWEAYQIPAGMVHWLEALEDSQVVEV
ncbi:MAG TPA: cupin domain-containing protein, partial [Thermoanaerobaculia bacterium]